MYRKARSMRNIKIELQDFEFGRRQHRQEVFAKNIHGLVLKSFISIFLFYFNEKYIPHSLS